MHIRALADVRGFDEGKGFSEERAMISSAQNRPWNTNYEEIMSAWFNAYSAKNNIADPDVVPIFRHGVIYRMAGDVGTDRAVELVSELQKTLEETAPPGWGVHIVNEGTSVSVRIGLGSYDKAKVLAQAERELSRNRERLHQLIRDIEGVLGDGWFFMFADIDDDYGY